MFSTLHKRNETSKLDVVINAVKRDQKKVLKTHKEEINKLSKTNL